MSLVDRVVGRAQGPDVGWVLPGSKRVVKKDENTQRFPPSERTYIYKGFPGVLTTSRNSKSNGTRIRKPSEGDEV